MTANSSVSFNDSLPLSSINTSIPFGLYCFIWEPNSSAFTAYTITNILILLPLCILILYRGLIRWRQQRSSSTAATTSHSDSFTYHLVTMEIIFVFGCILCCGGVYRKNISMLILWFYLSSFTWYGETFFHLLTCVEHYLAVVHPITYLSLRTERGIRIRNIIISCIWLFCFGWTGLITLENIALIMNFCLLPLSFIAIAFCSLSVLYILIHPGPGEQGQKRERVKQIKQRAFYTIVAILGVLFLRCAWNLVWSVVYMFISEINPCVVITGEMWFSLPSSLVLPLLFLQKAGALACCKNNIK